MISDMDIWNNKDNALTWAAQSDLNHLLAREDTKYPTLLQEITDPPPLLYVCGNIDILQHPQIAIVGSRRPTPSGLEIAQELSMALSGRNCIITSGLARGIDAAAHRGALKANKPTIAIMGTGPDVIYPRQHCQLAHDIVQNGGALVTEFPVGMQPIAHHFPRRNRIISGLSLGTLVVEATIQSGSLITARLANEQGKEVFAIPGSIYNPQSRGCHALIQQGAKLVETVGDILEELTLFDNLPKEKLTPKDDLKKENRYPPSTPDHFSREPYAQDMLDAIPEKLLQCISLETVEANTLLGRSDMPLTEMLAGLAHLQTQGYATQDMTGYKLTSQGLEYLRQKIWQKTLL